ncbi:MAG: helicase [Nitrospiraceae bacterium]|nr:MAG: helicase [Nitrospiraceae bacterium]
MIIPYVIDNQTYKLADILNAILRNHQGQSMDVVTAYFNIQGYRLIKDGLSELGSFRLLLGEEPSSGENIGLKPDPSKLNQAIRADLEKEPFNEETLRLVEDLIRFLRRENVELKLHSKGFLHAKCFLFYSDKPGQQMLFERFKPVVAIVGSSNFTLPGLTSNRELNLAHKVLLDVEEAEDKQAQSAVAWLSENRPSEHIKPQNRQLIKSEVGARAIIELEQWFERQWGDAEDYKERFIELLDASKFGSKEYTPYQVYMKALYEYFRDDLDSVPEQIGRSAVELSEFQEDAVKKARRILLRYDGVMIADSVGLGKTWIGKKLLEDYAYHMRQKALVVCPASLRDMWDSELKKATIAVTILSQEEIGQADFPVEEYGNADVILVDESHNFRNRNAQRYENLERIISLNAGRGAAGERKKIILLTATPINNDLFDLYNQMVLFTRGDRGYFTSAGIGDLYKYFLAARRASGDSQGITSLFNLLEEVVIRRTRQFIKKAYPDAMIEGKKIHFPERKLKTEYYDLEKTYSGIYEQIVTGIEKLKLPPYNLESYKKAGIKRDEFEAGREEALVGIFKSRYLKRFESSIAAFRISIKRALEFQKTFESYILDGKLIKSSDFHKALRYLEREEEEDDATPTSRAEEIDSSNEAKAVIGAMETVDPTQYNLRKLHEAVQHDIEILMDIWHQVNGISAEKDIKLQKLKEILSGPLKGEKTLIFTYYKDTARYLFSELGEDKGAAFRKAIGNPVIKRMDSGADPKSRRNIVKAFAPKANKKEEWVGTEYEINILISTDVLSEGQNLQDCANLINYDLHWNPTRMVQRAGRIDRIGTEFDTLWLRNMFPDEGLERLLRLVESLQRKISNIDRVGFLDASILGEVVHPKTFNTLKRIEDQDSSVVDEEEQFIELASSEFLLRQIQELLACEGKKWIDSLPNGIHSGLMKRGAKGMFFYFQAESEKGKHNFWNYYDINTGRIVDNRFLIANLISCSPETERVIGDYDVFEIQEKIIEHILKTYHEKVALESVPKVIDPIQQTLATTIQNYLNHPDVDRKEALEIIKYLNQPMPGTQVKELRKIYKEFQENAVPKVLVEKVTAMREKYGSLSTEISSTERFNLKREDLNLLCFDYLCG